MNCPYCGLSMLTGGIRGDRYSLKWKEANKTIFDKTRKIIKVSDFFEEENNCRFK